MANKQQKQANDMAENIEQTFQLEWRNKRFDMLTMLQKLCRDPNCIHFSPHDDVKCDTKFTKQDVLNDIKREWNWEKICLESFVTIDFALEYISKIEETFEDDFEQYYEIIDFVEELSASPNITMCDIENNIEKINWDWHSVARNPNLTFEFFLKNIANFYYLHTGTMSSVSKHPCITTDIVNKRSDIYWDFAEFALNPNITKEFILQHSDKMHLFTKYSQNPILTMEHVLTIPIKWDWSEISKNAGITMYDVKNHPDKPWVFACVLRNPNLTFDFVENNIEKIEMLVAKSNEPHNMDTLNSIDIFPSSLFMWICLKNTKFDIDRIAFLETRWKELLLVSVHEYYNEPDVRNTITFTVMELILFDTYLAKQITKY